jgi:hydroxymethylpyrimidine pyrophosphatase-like HAD family hydrolase
VCVCVCVCVCACVRMCVWIRDTPLSKILVLVSESELDAAMAILEAHVPKQTGHLIRGNFFIEILHPAINKGIGLAGLCKVMQVHPTRVCVLCVEW